MRGRRPSEHLLVLSVWGRALVLAAVIALALRGAYVSRHAGRSMTVGVS